MLLQDRGRKRWHTDYVNAILERDLKEITRIHRKNAMRELVHTLAAWSGKFMDLSAIGSGLSIRRPTIESYINALETLYLVERIYPWTKTDYARVGKQSRLFMVDSGLMASLLNWKMDQVRLDSDRSGKLIETFAICDGFRRIWQKARHLSASFSIQGNFPLLLVTTYGRSPSVSCGLST